MQQHRLTGIFVNQPEIHLSFNSFEKLYWADVLAANSIPSHATVGHFYVCYYFWQTQRRMLIILFTVLTEQHLKR